MAQANQKPKRRRGRPLKEDSVAIAADKAMFDYKTGVIGLVPDALLTLQGLLTNGTEKVKEGVAKFIIAEAKEYHEVYAQQDEEMDEPIPTIAEDHQDEEENYIPISLEVR